MPGPSGTASGKTRIPGDCCFPFRTWDIASALRIANEQATGNNPGLDEDPWRPYYIGSRYITARYITLRTAPAAMLKPSERHRAPEDELPLTPPTFQILLALVDSDRHGYAIMKEVADRTAGDIRLGPGTLYGSLKRLLEGGLVAEVGERADPELGDERRRCYRITPYGLAVARAEAHRMDAVVRAARRKKLLAPRPA